MNQLLLKGEPICRVNCILFDKDGTLVNCESASGFLTQAQTDDVLEKNIQKPLELDAGEVVLLHNWLIHSSDVNKTDEPRRAFSVCYMDAETKAHNGQKFPIIFGDGALCANSK